MLELQIIQTRPQKMDGQTDGVDQLLDLHFTKVTQVKIIVIFSDQIVMLISCHSKRKYLTFAADDSLKMSHGMIFLTMWYVRPAIAQISLRMRAV